MRRILLFALVLHAAVLGADLLAPYSPLLQDRAASLEPPAWASAHGAPHLLGTDLFGRDLFSRLLHGARLSLLAGVSAALLAVFLGTLLGLAAGYLGGAVDALVMRASELAMSLPWLYLLLGVRALLPLGTSPTTTLFVVVGLVGVLAWARPARLVRGVALEATRSDAVLAARGFGAGHRHLLWRHVLPHARATALTQLALLVPACIVAEVVLSFFGLGVPEPYPSLGTLLATTQNLDVTLAHPWLLSPVLALAVLVLSYHELAQALQSRDTGRAP